ncbi:unnamed protein product [Tilletia caries]|uniref:Uncharacterized protein n=1 Tax=Tilletia caries TaxID=13290 RepID=A0ABN7IV28_9BASI|nr:unnamed protein product [Tilletia caries]CAD6922590.1 unnamed protein product [Tilletia caries]CAD7066648.1 unnamed protein product [Tilletia caries]
MISDFFFQLTAAISLRVLCIYADNPWSVVAAWPKAEQIPAVLLTNNVFPIRFELMCWKQQQGEIAYFRFVGDDPEMQDLISTVAARSGKIGRLEAVPKRTVLAQISKDGVWQEKPFIGPRFEHTDVPVTVLDHNGDAASS